MVAGHVGFGNQFNLWIHAFHMPLFFFCSGYLFSGDSRQPYMDLCKRKAKAFLKPYIIFGMGLYTFWVITNLQEEKSLILPLIQLFTFNCDSTVPKILGPLWYLTTAFFMTLLGNGVFRLSKKFPHTEFVFAFCSLILMTIGILYSGGYSSLLGFDRSLVAIGFWYLGWIFHRYGKDGLSKILKRCSASGQYFFGGTLLLFDAVLIFYNGEVNIHDGCYGENVFLMVLNAFLMCIACIMIFQIWEEKANFTRIFSFFREIGTHSIWWLCINAFVIRYCRIILEKIFDNNISMLEISILVMVFSCTGIWLGVRLVRKTRFGLLVEGK